MPTILAVTAFCRNDVSLLSKRSDYLCHLEPKQDRDLLLVNDGTVDAETCNDLVVKYQRNFKNVILRSLLEAPPSADWPNNVNHVWRLTAKLVAGKYGDRIDVSDYYAWFYFEPDVTPLRAGWLQALESEYLRNKRPFLGKVNVTTAKQVDERTKTESTTNIQHMNGAGVYPIVTDYYNANMMLVDNLPWDVAGLSNFGGGIIKVADLGSAFYEMGFGTTAYSKNATRLSATQTIASASSPYSFELSNQYLHHGCKDGSLMDFLTNKEVIHTTVPTTTFPSTNAAGSTLLATPPNVVMPQRLQNIQPATISKVKFDSQGRVIDESKPTKDSQSISVKKLSKEQIEEIKLDKESGMSWKELIAKHKVSPAQLKKALHE